MGHVVTHAQLIELLAGITISDTLQVERAIALELERIAVHIGDTAALCTDVAYQFGQVVNEALRTTIINTTQLWCGNRFGKGLIRPGGYYSELKYEPIIQVSGDVLARAMLRNLEARTSIEMVTDWATALLATCNLQPATDNRQLTTDNSLQPSSFAISVTEGWRGDYRTALCRTSHGTGQSLPIRRY
ncbi:MAG: hypothetical protein WC865_08245 [Bacteroidales bacterium]